MTRAPLTKGRQITGPERERIATRLRDRYVQGASIRDLMAETGRSYGNYADAAAPPSTPNQTGQRTSR